MKFRSILSLAVLFALIGVLSGCSQQKPTVSATEAQPSAPAQFAASTRSSAPLCSLLTSADVEAVMGKGATTKANQPQTECILTGAAPLSVLTVNLMNYGGSWANLKEGFKKADPTLKDIPGLGEDAFTFMGGVVAKKGDRYVSVGGMLSNAPMTQVDGAKFLAGKILAEI